jgi:probable rRNA maturation factor
MKFEILNEGLFKYKNLLEILEKLFPELKGMSVNIVFLEEKEMQDLNSDLMGKNEVTDVLSLKVSEEIAEVYISPEYIKKNTKDFEIEVIRMIIHGILHIQGYEHKGYFDEENVDEEMFKLQERYLKEFYAIL